MHEQLQRIQQKLAQLRILDAELQLFGASCHQYQLNPPLSMEIIRQFEALYQITLPEDYVLFLTEMGNGGAGPFYGLISLKKSVLTDSSFRVFAHLLDPSLPFPHDKPWNDLFVPTCDDNDKSEFERQYFAYHRHQMDGVIKISDFGCAISINLVVNGAEYGYIWTDDRANSGRIQPSYELDNLEKVTFLDWYELWLDNSLNEIIEL